MSSTIVSGRSPSNFMASAAPSLARADCSVSGLVRDVGDEPRLRARLGAASARLARRSRLHVRRRRDPHACLDASAAQRAAELRDRAGSVKNVFSLGPSPHAEDLIALAHRADATSLQSDAVESDICWLIYTGGTTGRPKGVMDTHRALAGMAVTALAEYELHPRRLGAHRRHGHV